MLYLDYISTYIFFIAIAKVYLRLSNSLFTNKESVKKNAMEIFFLIIIIKKTWITQAVSKSEQ